MRTEFDVIVVGGGFAGIYATWALARDGVSVALIERSDAIGGTLRSRDWNGFQVDMGMHNFDLRGPPDSTFYEDILGSELRELDGHDWASTTGGAMTPGFEMPDFSTSDPELCRSALAELTEIEAAGQTAAPADLAAWFDWRFGPSLGARLRSMAEKVLGAPLEGIAAEAAAALGMFQRPKLGTDARMISLKDRGPFWDDRLGVSLRADHPRYSGRSTVRRFGYPASGALSGFCDAAHGRLAELGARVMVGTGVEALRPRPGGVEVQTGTDRLTCRRLFWSLPDHLLTPLLGLDIDMRAAAHPVGAAIHAFEVDRHAVNGPDYLHDFTPERIAYRYSRPGIFGGQVTDAGRSYILAEVPCHPSGAEAARSAQTADRAWQDMRMAGFIAPDATCHAREAWVYPVAYTLPRLAARELAQAAETALSDAGGAAILRIGPGQRGRARFIAHYIDTLHIQLKA